MDQTKSQAKSTALINGLFAIIVALISLIGGYLLKDPIEKAWFKPHCQVGGVWKPHGDLMLHCEVTKFEEEDSFTIRLQGSLTSGNEYVINGKGKMDRSLGNFSGIRYEFNDKTTKSEKVQGRIGLQGCDGLGVVMAFETGWEKNYSFIRETPNTLGKPDDEGEEKK